MTTDHVYTASERCEPIYGSARAEAAKTLALPTDLGAATATLRQGQAVLTGESVDRSDRIK